MGIIVGCCNIIEQDNAILLVKETKPEYEGQYSWPAGKLEVRESLLDCAKREAKEETGFEIEPTEFIGVYQRFSPTDNIVDFVFYSQIVAGKLTPSAEHPEAKFFSPDELKGLEAKGLLRHPAAFRQALDDYRAGKAEPVERLHFLDQD